MLYVLFLEGFVEQSSGCLCHSILPFLRVFIYLSLMCADLQWSVKMSSFRTLLCAQNLKIFLVSKHC